jgi:hypothetical protein
MATNVVGQAFLPAAGFPAGAGQAEGLSYKTATEPAHGR